MGGMLKGFSNYESDKLLCGEDGVWKTGYEDVGLDITGLCFPRGIVHFTCINTANKPLNA